MPLSMYLSGAVELETYGVPAATQSQIMQASQLIDMHLARPAGCVWAPDAVGMPCYMASLDPLMTLTAQGAISPGAAVQVSLPGYTPDETVLGEAVILDRANPRLVEACTIQAFAPGLLTLQNVYQSHPGPVTIDFGMAITEERQMPNQRSLIMLGQWPISRVISGVGRYGYGRRSDQMLGYFDDVNLLSMFSTFGGPPAWESFEIQASSLNPMTGQLWVPSGVLLSYFTDVKLRYVGGWQASALPKPIKAACAMLIQTLSENGMGPNVRRFSTGKVTIERFTQSVVNEDIAKVLRPYRAYVMG